MGRNHSETVPKAGRKMTETTLENVLAKLTANERTVVLRRLAGLSCAEIGRAMGCTRQNVHIQERSACAKLGIQGTIQSVVIDAGARDRRAVMLEMGRRGIGEVHRREYAQGLRGRVSRRERLQARIEALASELMAESEKGELTDERKAYYERECAALAQALARVECEE